MREPEAIAIVGLAGRFPGAGTVDEFWQNLLEGVESISFFDDDQLRAAGVPEKSLRDPNYVKAAPVLEDIELFDAGFFGMGARDAQVMDPQFRVFLEVCATALQHAGIAPSSFGGRIGMYAGSKENYYLEENVYRSASALRAAGMLLTSVSNHTDYLSTTVAYRLGLTGPAISMVTACSTSLVAMHTAIRALRARECEAALAGAVEIAIPTGRGYLHRPGGMFSPDGHVRAFDAAAGGTVFGSGAGAIVLKRLADAIADRDTIHAVIRGSAINNDGAAKNAFTAPSKVGQVAVMAAALEDAGVDPCSVGLVEAHGTGTLVGDPIEVGALTEVYGAHTDRTGYCVIGSVKSNVGHLGAAAGMASMIKAVHCVREGIVPPSINFERLNPRIDLENSPFFVSTELTSWAVGDTPRRAAVSSFGVGGTNAHLIVEQAPDGPPPAPSLRPRQLITISARSREALDSLTEELGEHLDRLPGTLADAAYTLTAGRPALPVRRFAVLGDGGAATETLTCDLPARTAVAGRTVAFLFPGQGAQYPGMGADLYSGEPVFRTEIDRCAKILAESHGLDLTALLLSADADAKHRLDQTAHTQPALFAVEYALAMTLRGYGIEPAALAGHSVGEYVAATIAGVFALDDALRLVADRGALMQALPGGAMAAVTLPEKLLLPLLPDSVDIAAVNAPGVCVVSGSRDDLAELEEVLSAQGVACRPLHTSHAFHSRMMDPILADFGARVAKVPLSAPRIPFVSNLTGTWIADDEATDPDYWVRHLRGSVRFSATLALLAGDGERILAEVGPGRTLSGLVAAHNGDAVAVATMRHPQQQRDDVETLLEGAGRIWAEGGPVDWQRFWGEEQRRRVPVPPVPFSRQRHWVEPDEEEAAVPANVGAYTVPVWRETGPVTPGTAEGGLWVVLTDGAPAIAEFTELARRAGAELLVAGPGADLTELFQDVAAWVPERITIVHALAAGTRPQSASEDEYAGQWLEAGFFSVLAVLQEVARQLPGVAVDLAVVTRDMQDVAGDGRIEPAKAAILGIVKLAPKELEHFTCRSIDLGDGPPALVAGQLLAEVTAGGTAEQVAYRGRKRWTWGYDSLNLTERDETPAVLRPGGVYLITGGLGGLGLVVARQLAELAGARLVLAGRTGLPARDSWPDLLAAGDPAAEKIRAIQQIEAAGGRVLPVACDVTDERQVRELKNEIDAAFGGLDGIFHLAGVAGGGMLETRAREDSARVFAAKVHGTYLLDRVFAPALFVLYSSIAAISGDFGLGDYAGANSVMDAYAAAHWSEGHHVISVNWPPWSDVGMAYDIDAPAILGSLRRGAPEAEVAGDGAAGTAAPVPVRHPMLRSRLDAADGSVIFEVEFSPDLWVVNEHRFSGVPIMPGTGIVEFVRAAFEEATGNPRAEITNLLFLELLVVTKGLQIRLQLSPDGAGGYTVLVDGSDGRQYVRGHVGPAPAPPGESARPRHDLAAIRARCPQNTTPEFTGQIGILSFGPRWYTIKDRVAGGTAEVVTVELPPEFAADLDEYYLHPSLLDTSVAVGQDITVKGSYLPFSYDKLTVRGPLRGRVHSIITHLDKGTGDVSVSDIVIVDDEGGELVAIEGFTLLGVDGSTGDARFADTRLALLSAAQEGGLSDEELTSALADDGAEPQAAGSAVRSPLPSGVEDLMSGGVRTAEGCAALRLILANVTVDGVPGPTGPQVIWCPEGLPERMRSAARVTRAALTSQAAGGKSAGGTRDLATRYVEPATDAERALAQLWADGLGIDRVGAEDDFFDLGGNSLVAVQLVSRIAQRFRVEASVAQLFDARTVRGLAADIEASLVQKVAELSEEEALQALKSLEGE